MLCTETSNISREADAAIVHTRAAWHRMYEGLSETRNTTRGSVCSHNSTIELFYDQSIPISTRNQNRQADVEKFLSHDIEVESFHDQLILTSTMDQIRKG